VSEDHAVADYRMCVRISPPRDYAESWKTHKTQGCGGAPSAMTEPRHNKSGTHSTTLNPITAVAPRAEQKQMLCRSPPRTLASATNRQALVSTINDADPKVTRASPMLAEIYQTMADKSTATTQHDHNESRTADNECGTMLCRISTLHTARILTDMIGWTPR